MKFGGSTVGTIAGLTQVLSIVLYERERWKRLLLIVSALDGVTDMLLEAGSLAQMGNRRGYRRIIANLRTRHLALIEHLPLAAAERAALQADIDRLWFDLIDICQTLSGESAQPPPPGALDAVIGVGERLAARIVAALLRQNQVRGVAIDATDILITDDVPGNATPNIEETHRRVMNHLMPMLDRGIIPVITGFIGATIGGKPTTLGRGGSDLSASTIGLSVSADEVWLWTDVDGMMSADPNEIDDACVVPAMSYSEASEMAYFGAHILHPRMIQPLRERRIPLRVRNAFKPQMPGTLIDASRVTSPPYKAVTSIQGIGFSLPRRGSIRALIQMIDDTLFAQTRLSSEVIISAQSSEHSFVCIVIPTTAGLDVSHALRLDFEDRLRSQPELGGWTVETVTIVSVIGEGLGENAQNAGRVFAALEGIRVLAVSYDRTRCSISLVVAPADEDRALALLHNLILNSARYNSSAPRV
jgi:aspartate kinase